MKPSRLAQSRRHSSEREAHGVASAKAARGGDWARIPTQIGTATLAAAMGPACRPGVRMKCSNSPKATVAERNGHGRITTLATKPALRGIPDRHVPRGTTGWALATRLCPELRHQRCKAPGVRPRVGQPPRPPALTNEQLELHRGDRPGVARSPRIATGRRRHSPPHPPSRASQGGRRPSPESPISACARSRAYSRDESQPAGPSAKPAPVHKPPLRAVVRPKGAPGASNA